MASGGRSAVVDVIEVACVGLVVILNVFVSRSPQWKATLSSPVLQAHMLLLGGGGGARTPVARAFV